VVWPEVAEAVTEQEQEQEQEQEPAQVQVQAQELVAVPRSSLSPRSFDSRYHRNP
jgi:hypothetical protein